MKALSIEEELTPEGKRIWDNIANYEKLALGISLLPPDKREKIKPPSMFELELMFIRTELRRMILNSERVIQECDQIILTYKTQDEYISSDAKVAKTIHENLITRLQRILDTQNAFEHDIEVIDEPRRHQHKRLKEGIT